MDLNIAPDILFPPYRIWSEDTIELFCDYMRINSSGVDNDYIDVVFPKIRLYG